MVQSAGDLPDVVDRSLQRHGAALGHQFVDVGPVDELQRDEQVPVDLARVIDGDNVLVLELGGCRRFRLEAADERFVRGPLLVEHLERDRPLEIGVDGQIDRPHAAGAELAYDLIFAESRSARQRRLARRIRSALALRDDRSRRHRRLNIPSA